MRHSGFSRCVSAAKFLIPALFFAAIALPLPAGRTSAPHTPPSKHCGIAPHVSPASPPRARFTLDDIYTSSDSVPIPDWPGDTAESVIRIGDTVAIQDINVFVDIRHTWIRDLRISLTVSDDPGEVVLLDLLPMDSAVDLRGWFDDDAGASILQADTPLVGSWRPLEALSAFHGRSAEGDWTLRVLDRFRLDSGYIAGWRININPVVNLQGVVRNSLTRAPVRGAVLYASEAGLAVRTGSTGSYAFSGLDAGTHTILFTKADYETLTVSGVAITGGQTTTLDTVMRTLPGRWEFASTARAPVAIPDSGDSAAMSLTVNADVTIDDLDVTVNIEHAWMSDLDLYLVGPQGTVVHLAPSGTGGEFDGYVDCRFDDEAALSITQGFYPFTGHYRPIEQLSAFNGRTTAGIWSLRAVDGAPDDVGTIYDFTLHVQGQPASVGGGRDVPHLFVFHGCSPNPFNARTEFRFDLARPARVSLTIFNLLGREVGVVTDRRFEAGSQRLAFDASDLPSGLYFARLTSERAMQTTKIVLIK